MARPKFSIGGTDARRIMAGEWLAVYNEIMGIEEPEDLSDVFRVQLGVYTEPFHAEWFAKMSGLFVIKANVKSDILDGVPVHASPDYEVEETGDLIELKHSHERNDLRNAAKYYAAQLHWQMHIFGKKQIWLSIIPGNKDPEFGLVDWSQDYWDQLATAVKSFWWHVENKQPPEDQGEIANPKIVNAIKIAGKIDADMQGNNQWGHLADQYLTTKHAHGEHEQAKKTLKELVTPEMHSAEGYGVRIERNKRGHLLFKDVQEKAA